MNVFETLGVALGLAALAGLNLYLTVFAMGLALHFNWVGLPASLSQLSVLGHTWIVVVAGLLYFLQFFADKIPWLDTLNDGIHTVIRPLGAALVAVLALGDAHPVLEVIAALLAGGAALTTHLTKTGTRLIANTSPEPVSNIGLSLGEDAIVLGGLGLLAWHPIIGICVILGLLILAWVFLPALLRGTRAIIWLAWKKLNEPARGLRVGETMHRLPGNCELLLRRAHATTEAIILAVPCLSGGGERLPKNIFGWLVRFEGGRLFFVSARWVGTIVLEIPFQSASVTRESRFLVEKLIVRRETKVAHIFLFDRGSAQTANRVAELLGAKEVKERPLEIIGQDLSPATDVR